MISEPDIKCPFKVEKLWNDCFVLCGTKQNLFANIYKILERDSADKTIPSLNNTYVTCK